MPLAPPGATENSPARSRGELATDEVGLGFSPDFAKRKAG